MSSVKEFYVDLEVKFGKTVVSLEMPASATVQELKTRLEAQTQVRADKQRLLLNLPVVKAKQRDPPSDTLLRLLFPADLVARCEQHDGPVAQHLRVGAMLLGSAEVAPTVNVAATTEVSRLVATTVEHDGKWYRCSYGKGYLRQTAYVCRTCVNEGRADPAHVLCLACAEFCHGNHEVEEWGLRYYMRCDCCTHKCWRPPTDPAAAAEAAAERRSALHPNSPGISAPAVEVRPVHTHEIEQRTMRKRPRSTSPLTPKRSRGSSPMGGIRMTTIPPPDMPEVALRPSTNAASAAAAPPSGSTAGFPADPLQPPATAPSAVAAAMPSSTTEAPASAFDAANAASAAAARHGNSNGHREEGAEKKEHQKGCSPETKAMNGEGTADAADDSEEEDEEAKEDGAAAAPPLPELSRCAFVVDSKTHRVPVESVLPRNRLNRYPRDACNWCYCKNAHPSDDPECGGIGCMLCCSCYWSTHITRLHTLQYRRMPCYGDVLLGDTLAFKCRTCKTHVCVPCRYRCHKDHDIDETPVVPSHDDGTDNGAFEGAQFSCGCRGLCAIAEEVPEEMIDDTSTYDPIPDAVAVELMNDDIFTGFVCAYCMQEHPWLATDDPRQCYQGQLPAKVTASKPVVACGAKPAADPKKAAATATLGDADEFPYHGMLLPVNAFMPGMTCDCAPCRAAFETFAPRSTENATEMILELHDRCDNCASTIKDQQAFMCRTCEMKMDETFFLCRDCNALRGLLVQNINRVQASTTTIAQADDAAPVPPPSVSDRTAAAPSGDAPARAENVAGNPEGDAAAAAREAAARGYHHDLSHDFVEDTFENLYALCGMQILQNMDVEAQQHVTSNWDPAANRAELANSLSQTLGQIPLQFDEAELREIAALNQQRNEASKPK